VRKEVDNYADLVETNFSNKQRLERETLDHAETMKQRDAGWEQNLTNARLRTEALDYIVLVEEAAL